MEKINAIVRKSLNVQRRSIRVSPYVNHLSLPFLTKIQYFPTSWSELGFPEVHSYPFSKFKELTCRIVVETLPIIQVNLASRKPCEYLAKWCESCLDYLDDEWELPTMQLKAIVHSRHLLTHRISRFDRHSFAFAEVVNAEHRIGWGPTNLSVSIFSKTFGIEVDEASYREGSNDLELLNCPQELAALYCQMKCVVDALLCDTPFFINFQRTDMDTLDYASMDRVASFIRLPCHIQPRLYPFIPLSFFLLFDETSLRRLTSVIEFRMTCDASLSARELMYIDLFYAANDELQKREISLRTIGEHVINNSSLPEEVRALVHEEFLRDIETNPGPAIRGVVTNFVVKWDGMTNHSEGKFRFCGKVQDFVMAGDRKGQLKFADENSPDVPSVDVPDEVYVKFSLILNFTTNCYKPNPVSGRLDFFDCKVDIEEEHPGECTLYIYPNYKRDTDAAIDEEMEKLQLQMARLASLKSVRAERPIMHAGVELSTTMLPAKEMNVTLVSQEVTKHQLPVSGMSMLATSDPAWNYTQMMARPIEIGNGVMDTTMAVGRIMSEFNVSTTLQAFEHFVDPYLLCRWKAIHYQVQFASTQFQVGGVALSYVLDYWEGPSFNNAGIAGLMPLPGKRISLTAGASIEIVVPYGQQQLYIPVGGKKAPILGSRLNDHRTFLWVTSPLQVGTGTPTSVPFVIWAWFEDFEVSIRQPNSTTSLKRPIMHGAVVSAVSDVVNGVGSMVRGGIQIAKGAGKIIAMMDKPERVTPTIDIAPNQYHTAMVNVALPNPTVKFAMCGAQLQFNHFEEFGCDMNLEILCKQPAYIGDINFSTSNAKGDNIFSFTINPYDFTGVTLPVLPFINLCYFYRCTFVFHISMFPSFMHQGRILASVVYGDNQVSPIDGTVTSFVFGQDNEIEVKVPYRSTMAYFSRLHKTIRALPGFDGVVYPDGNTAQTTVMNVMDEEMVFQVEHYCTLNLIVQNALQASEAVNTTVKGFVTLTLEDFECAVPCSGAYNFIEANQPFYANQDKYEGSIGYDLWNNSLIYNQGYAKTALMHVGEDQASRGPDRGITSSTVDTVEQSLHPPISSEMASTPVATETIVAVGNEQQAPPEQWFGDQPITPVELLKRPVQIMKMSVVTNPSNPFVLRFPVFPGIFPNCSLMRAMSQMYAYWHGSLNFVIKVTNPVLYSTVVEEKDDKYVTIPTEVGPMPSVDFQVHFEPAIHWSDLSATCIANRDISARYNNLSIVKTNEGGVILASGSLNNSVNVSVPAYTALRFFSLARNTYDYPFGRNNGVISIVLNSPSLQLFPNQPATWAGAGHRISADVEVWGSAGDDFHFVGFRHALVGTQMVPLWNNSGQLTPVQVYAGGNMNALENYMPVSKFVPSNEKKIPTIRKRALHNNEHLLDIETNPGPSFWNYEPHYTWRYDQMKETPVKIFSLKGLEPKLESAQMNVGLDGVLLSVITGAFGAMLGITAVDKLTTSQKDVIQEARKELINPLLERVDGIASFGKENLKGALHQVKARCDQFASKNLISRLCEPGFVGGFVLDFINFISHRTVISLAHFILRTITGMYKSITLSLVDFLTSITNLLSSALEGSQLMDGNETEAVEDLPEELEVKEKENDGDQDSEYASVLAQAHGFHPLTFLTELGKLFARLVKLPMLPLRHMFKWLEIGGRLGRALHFMKNIKEDFMSFGNMIFEFFLWIAEYFVLFDPGHSAIRTFLQDRTAIEKFLAAVETCTCTDAATRINTDAGFRQLVCACHYILGSIPLTQLGEEDKKFLRSKRAKLGHMFAMVQKTCDDGYFRPDPFSIYISGDAGVGKSTLSSDLVAQVIPSCGLKHYSEQLIQWVNSSDDYISGLQDGNVAVAGFDDFNAFKNAESKDVKVYHALKTGNRFEPVRPFGDKGMPWGPVLMIACSNLVMPDSNDLQCKEALLRRRDILFEARIKDTYKGKKISEIPEDVRDTFEHLNFRRMDPLKGTPFNYGTYTDPKPAGWISYPQVVHCCSVAAAKHTAIQRRLVLKMKAKTDNVMRVIDASVFDDLYHLADVLLAENELLPDAFGLLGHVVKDDGSKINLLSKFAIDEVPSSIAFIALESINNLQAFKDGVEDVTSLEEIRRQMKRIGYDCDLSGFETLQSMIVADRLKYFLLKYPNKEFIQWSAEDRESASLQMGDIDDELMGYLIEGARGVKINQVRPFSLVQKGIDKFGTLRQIFFNLVDKCKGSVKNWKTWAREHPKLSILLGLGTAGVAIMTVGKCFNLARGFMQSGHGSGDFRTMHAKHVVPQVVSAKMHVGETQASNEITRRLVHKNLVRVAVDGHAMFGVAVGGRDILTLKHLFAIRQKKGETIQTVKILRCAGTPQIFPFADCQVVYSESRDLALIRLPKYAPAFAEATQHFASKQEIQHLGDGQGRVLTWRDNLPMAYTLQYERNSRPLVVEHPFDASITHRHLETWVYNWASSIGDCGSILMTEQNLSGRIIGLHSAALDTTSFSQIVWREYIQEMRDAFQEKQIVRSAIMHVTETDNWEQAFPIVGFHPIAVVKGVRLAEKTQIVPSLIKGVLQEPVSEPAVLSPKDKRYDLDQTPMQIGMTKFNSGSPIFDVENVKRVKEFYQDIYISKCPPSRNLSIPMTPAMAVDPPFANYQRINCHSSEGYPYVNWRPRGWKGSTWMFDNTPEHLLISDERLEQDALRLCYDSLHGEYHPSVWVATLKDERRKLDKIKYPRVFTAGNKAFTIFHRMHCLDFIMGLVENRHEIGHGVGTNVHSNEWALWYHQLKSKGDNWIAGDHKHFDGKVSGQLFSILFEICQAWNKHYGADVGEHDMCYESLIQDHCNGTVLINNLLVALAQGEPSGSPSTASFNTEYNRYLFALAWLDIMKDNGEMKTLNKFQEHVFGLYYGDDVVLSVSSEALPAFNMNTLQAWFADHGLVFTDPTKVEGAEQTPCILPEKATFLKRYFKTTDLQDVVYCPMEDGAWQEICNWIRDTPGVSPQEATLQNAEDTVRESFYHGEKVFQEVKKKINRRLRLAGCQPVVLSYRELFKELYGHSLPDQRSLKLFSCVA